MFKLSLLLFYKMFQIKYIIYLQKCIYSGSLGQLYIDSALLYIHCFLNLHSTNAFYEVEFYVMHTVFHRVYNLNIPLICIMEGCIKHIHFKFN